MYKYIKSRNGLIHLYNPKKEGLGSYDVHYINAHKKDKKHQSSNQEKRKERYVAWFHSSEACQS